MNAHQRGWLSRAMMLHIFHLARLGRMSDWSRIASPRHGRGYPVWWEQRHGKRLVYRSPESAAFCRSRVIAVAKFQLQK